MVDSNKKLFKQLETLHNAKRDLKDRPKKKAKKPTPPKPKPLLHTPPPVSTLPSPAPATLPTTPATGYYDQYATEGMNLMSPDFGHPQSPGSTGGWHSITSRAKAKQTKDTMKGLENYNKMASMVPSNASAALSGEDMFNNTLAELDTQEQYRLSHPLRDMDATQHLSTIFSDQGRRFDQASGHAFDPGYLPLYEFGYGLPTTLAASGIWDAARPTSQHALRRSTYFANSASNIPSKVKALEKLLKVRQVVSDIPLLNTIATRTFPHARNLGKSFPFIEGAIDVAGGGVDVWRGSRLYDQHHKAWQKQKDSYPADQWEEYNIPEPQRKDYILGSIRSTGDNTLSDYMSSGTGGRLWYDATHTFSPYSLYAAGLAANKAQADGQEDVQNHYSNFPESLGPQLAHNAGFAENAPNFSYDLSSMPAPVRGAMGKHMESNETLKRIDDDWDAWYHWNPYSIARQQGEKAFIHRPSAEDTYSVTRYMINEIRQGNITKEDFTALVNAGVVELGKPAHNMTFETYTALGGWPRNPDEYYDTMQALPKDIKILPLQAPKGLTKADLLEPPIEASHTDETARSQHEAEAEELQRDQQADELEEKRL